MRRRNRDHATPGVGSHGVFCALAPSPPRRWRGDRLDGPCWRRSAPATAEDGPGQGARHACSTPGPHCCTTRRPSPGRSGDASSIPAFAGRPPQAGGRPRLVPSGRALRPAPGGGSWTLPHDAADPHCAHPGLVASAVGPAPAEHLPRRQIPTALQPATITASVIAPNGRMPFTGGHWRHIVKPLRPLRKKWTGAHRPAGAGPDWRPRKPKCHAPAERTMK
jgi:hypothetical protein